MINNSIREMFVGVLVAPQGNVLLVSAALGPQERVYFFHADLDRVLSRLRVGGVRKFVAFYG